MVTACSTRSWYCIYMNMSKNKVARPKPIPCTCTCTRPVTLDPAAGPAVPVSVGLTNPDPILLGETFFYFGSVEIRSYVHGLSLEDIANTDSRYSNFQSQVLCSWWSTFGHILRSVLDASRSISKLTSYMRIYNYVVWQRRILVSKETRQRSWQVSYWRVHVFVCM